MWTYSQTTGKIRDNGVDVGTGYSGHGLGLQNPYLEDEQDVGPIPRGIWQIVRWDDQHGDKGPVVGVLQPIGHDAHGRSGFLIHGDNSAQDRSASHGCIIASRTIRDAWRASNDHQIEVVA